MSTALNLDKYFERIGYEGTASPVLDTLKSLHQKHTEAIPFENLNPLLGMEVKLDPKSLEQKMIDNQRGGYCYEQNLLFKYVLETIGFPVKGLAARIRWNKKEGEITPRSHMLLLIEIDGKNYLADTGFGSQTLTGPLHLETGKVQQTPHESRRLIRKDGEFVMQTRPNDEWKSLYQFNLNEHYREDYEISSWYLCNHPQSHFVTDLITARPEPGVRYTLQNNTFTTYRLGKEKEKQTLNTVNELRDVLENKFILSLPQKEGLDQKLSQLIKTENN